MKVRSFVISFLLIFFSCLTLTGKDFMSRDYRRAARRFRIEIKQQLKLPTYVKAEPLSAEKTEHELNRFFAALDDLGEKFVKECGLRKVMICQDLSRNGMASKGFAYQDYICLKSGFSKKTVYHELFHLLDKKKTDPQWLKLNHKDFRYLGKNYPDRQLSAARKKMLRDHYRKVKRRFYDDFVSRYAQTDEREDRAETFAAMIGDGYGFSNKARKNRVLYKKMLYIIKMTERDSLFEKDFWRRKLGDVF